MANNVLSAANIGFINPVEPPTSKLLSKPAIRVTDLWQNLNNPKIISRLNLWAPDSSANDEPVDLKPHALLDRHIKEMPFLPLDVTYAVGLYEARENFKQILSEARILAQGNSIIWGCDSALGLIKAVGSETVIQAHDHATPQALDTCSVGLSLVLADQLVRQALGDIVQNDESLIHKIALIETKRPLISDVNEPAISSYYDKENKLIVKIDLCHDSFRPAGLIVVAARNYHDMRVVKKLDSRNLARLTGQRINKIHLKMFYAMFAGSIEVLCRKIDPNSVSDEELYGVHIGVQAFEECCRHFGEDFMLRTMYGATPETSHPMLIQQRLRKIVPKLKRFILGEKASWG